MSEPTDLSEELTHAKAIEGEHVLHPDAPIDVAKLDAKTANIIYHDW